MLLTKLALVALFTLLCFVVQGTVVVTGAPGNHNEETRGIRIRREINKFADSGPPFDLFILSLKALQERKQTDKLSYFQIAGK